jgi:hypothetical protein
MACEDLIEPLQVEGSPHRAIGKGTSGSQPGTLGEVAWVTLRELGRRDGQPQAGVVEGRGTREGADACDPRIL